MVKNLQNILLYVAFYLSFSAVICIFVADYKYGLHEEYSSGHRPLFQRREVHHPIWRYASGEGICRGLYIKYLCEAPVSGSLAFCFFAKPDSQRFCSNSQIFLTISL